MTDYGTKIAKLRAANKMTQAELGAQLNVTSQAVSKWENGLSEPDMESIRKMCQIFNITFDEFFGAEPKQEATEVSAQQAPEQGGVILAYCDVCDKPLYNPKEFQVTIEDGVQHTTCTDCIPKKEEMKRQAQREKVEKENKAREEQRTRERKARQATEFADLKKGLLWGILGAVLLAVITIIATVTTQQDVGIIILGAVLGAYGGYALLTQFIWVNSVWDVFGFFLRTLKLPGVIFTLDIEGLLFLIFVKVLGAILSAIFSVVLFIIGFFVTWAYAMIIFPFALIKEIRDIKTMY